VTVNISVRQDDRLAKQLKLSATAAGETVSDRLRRYAEEGARRDEHPMITFRDGPTGRRPGLITGPDVWEIAMWIDDLPSKLKDPAKTLAQDGTVTRAQIEAALRYRAAYPEEIQARIDLHRSHTAAAAQA
jgi:uncharacterized protein (DUF433 family)